MSARFERSAEDRAAVDQYRRVFGSARPGEIVSVSGAMFKPTRSPENLSYAIERARDAGDTELLEALRAEYRYRRGVTRRVDSLFIDTGVMNG